MITLSLNFDGILGKTERSSHEKKVREVVDTHLAFPGSDKLKVGFTIKDNGSSSVTFAGPEDIVSEAKRLWQENVKPTADRVQSAAKSAVRTTAKKASASFKKAKTTVKKAKATVARKSKKVRVSVKTSKPKKASSKKKTASKKKILKKKKK